LLPLSPSTIIRRQSGGEPPYSKLENAMKNRPITPVLMGRGMAGQAVLKSIAIVIQTDPELELLPVRIVSRGDQLDRYVSGDYSNVLFVANPSGLHARSIAEGVKAKFSAVVTDKPVCVRREELASLKNIAATVTVLHGYRVMWGTRTIKQMIDAGELGEVFSIESRYWQSSSAQMALKGAPEKRTWKNDLHLNGPSDALIDLGSHVADTCLYLMGEAPAEGRCWLSYRNAPAPHRDTHVHVSLKFSRDRRAQFSISKTLHGATNNFEYTVIATKGAATWRFLQPDEIEYGTGNRTSIIRREIPNASSGSLPFHGLGWLEGYVEITRQTLRKVSGLVSVPVPTLEESLAAMDVLLNAQPM
jgi:predicted dehydrogenase